MANPRFDPGLTEQFTAPVRRMMNPDGSFNVHRSGTVLRDFHPYLHLISMGWVPFLLTLLLGYTVTNSAFAAVYFSLGRGHLHGADAPTELGRFLNDFFFSAHTLTTVGYGNIWPSGPAANVVAVLEALVGVLGFAVATGLLFGRVSRPSARIGFSDGMLVSPYQGGTALEFRVVNRRANDLMDVEVRVMLMTVEARDGRPQRSYKLLTLERDKVVFMPLTWTVVHPIGEGSPIAGFTDADLRRLQAEVLVVIRAYDDTFGQSVIARHSYRFDEVLWQRSFAPAFVVDDEGDLQLDLRKVSELN